MAPKHTLALALAASCLRDVQPARTTLQFHASENASAQAYAPVSYSTGQSVLYLGSLVKMQKGMSVALCPDAQHCDAADGMFDSHWELKYGKVTSALKEIPEKYKTGEIKKANDLGEFILNDLLWDEDPYLKSIALGAPVEVHHWVRPILDKLMGEHSVTWSPELVREHVGDYLAGRDSFDTATDTFLMCTKMLHKFMLGWELSDAEAKEFVEWQGQLPVFIVLPKPVAYMGYWNAASKLRGFRAKMLAKYMERIQAACDRNAPELPMRTLLEEQNRKCDEETKHVLAHGILDALAFAGGLSVPGIMRIGLAVLHAKASPWAEADRASLTDEDGVQRFVWEVIRRFPPVLAFSFWDRSFSKRTVLGLGMAMRDPEIWGGDALDFKLRDLAAYEKYGRVAWALESNEEPLGHYSRGCPGAGLSFTIANQFFEEWALLQQACKWEIPDDKVAFSDYNPWATDHVLSRGRGQMMSDAFRQHKG